MSGWNDSTPMVMFILLLIYICLLTAWVIYLMSIIDKAIQAIRDLEKALNIMFDMVKDRDCDKCDQNRTCKSVK